MITPSLEIVYPASLTLLPPRWRCMVNLVCVHDVGGSSKTTWHHEESGKTWISDPEFFGSLKDSARVWTYSFNSDPSVNMTPASIALHANELLGMLNTAYINYGGNASTIFIAHGLGGIIVKKAIILAWSCPEFFTLRNCFAGIVFLDTVHHSTDSEGVLKAIKTTAALNLHKGSLSPSLDDTRQYADAVREVNTSFLQRLPSGLDMLNFVATRRIEIVRDGEEPHKILVVPRRCVELESTQSKTIIVDCNHFQLTHFPSPADRIYLQLADPVVNMVTKASMDTSKRVFFPPPPPVFRKAPVPPPSPDPDSPVIKPRPMMCPPGLIPSPPPDESENPYELWLFKRNNHYTQQRRNMFLDLLGGWVDAHLGHDIHPMPGTCTWIQSHPWFLDWVKSTTTSVFYVYGAAGCGKTHLAKAVANHLSWNNGKQDQNIVLPFFCNVTETGDKEPPMMEYFIKSLLRLKPHWFNNLGPQYQFPDHERRKLSMGSLINILRDLMSRMQGTEGLPRTTNVFFIVDGINECDVLYVRELLQLIETLLDHPAANTSPQLPTATPPPPPPGVHVSGQPQVYQRETVRFKFFFTYSPNETMTLASVNGPRIVMSDENVRKDIDTYVHIISEEIYTLKKIMVSTPEAATWIKERAGTFFPFAKYSLLDGLSTGKDYEFGFSWNRRALPCPRKLGEYYDHDLLPLFQSIDNDNYVLVALMIILGARTPVTANEIRDALPCLFNDPRLSIIDLRSVMSDRCPRLIKFSDDLDMHPIHASLEFHFRNHVSQEEQDANMASLCLKYLSQPIFRGFGLSRSELAKRHAFYAYAANNWQEHVRLSNDQTKLIPQLREFIGSPGYLTWCLFKGYARERGGPPPAIIACMAPAIALIPANAAHLAERVVDMVPELYYSPDPWKARILSRLWDARQMARRTFPKLAEMSDSWKGRGGHKLRDHNHKSALMHAAMDPQGLPDMVEHFLKWPSKINYRDSDTGSTALMFLCENLNNPVRGLAAHLVNSFVDAGANPNSCNYKGETCLWMACRRGQLILVEELLRAGADPNISDLRGSTPLHQAFGKPTPNSFAIIKKLVQAGADVDIRFPVPDKLIPLTAAVENMLFDTFLFLLDYADINQVDEGGNAAIHPLVQPKYIDWLPHLLDQPGLDIDVLTDCLTKQGEPMRRTALSYAMYDENFKAVEMLLKTGASPYGNPKTTDKSPLYEAVHCSRSVYDDDTYDFDAEAGNLDIAQVLLDYKSPINTLDRKSKQYDRSPLMRAITIKNYPMVELLLKNGADPTLEEAYGLPGPLDAAMEEGEIDVIKMLLENPLPPNINHVPDKYNHILGEATQKSAELVQVLLDYGADTKCFLTPGSKVSPLHGAAQDGNLDLVKIFIEREPELVNHQDETGLMYEAPLNIAAREGHLDIVRALLEAGAIPDRASFHYAETPLWSACYRCKDRKKLEIVRLLHEKASDTLNMASYDGETPLMAACKAGELKVVEFLLEKGANVTTLASSGLSCVSKALDSKKAPPFKIIELLLQHGLGFEDVVNASGFTVLGQACHDGNVPTVRMLLEKGAEPEKAQKWPGDGGRSRWRSAAHVATLSLKPKVLEVLLAHPRAAEFIGATDFNGQTILHENIPPNAQPELAMKIYEAGERIKKETGVDYFDEILNVKSVLLKTPLDAVLDAHHGKPTDDALAKVDETIRGFLSELAAAPELTLNEHAHILWCVTRLLFIRGQYDEQAVRLLQYFLVDLYIKETEDHFDHTVWCEFYCDECGNEEEEEALFFCRYCRYNTARCCIKECKGIHDLVEVPVVMDRKILDLNSDKVKDVLRILELDFVINENPRMVEDSQPVLFEVDPESENTTLSLAFLHAMGYLEFHRRAWSPYLPLAPKVYKRIDPWEPFMREQRRDFQEWIWEMETRPWRLRDELGYFLGSGRRSAYKDIDVVKMEQILRDISWLFEPEPMPSPDRGGGRRKLRVRQVVEIDDDYEVWND